MATAFTVAAAGFLLFSASAVTWAQTRTAPHAARVAGTITVSISSTRLKHWGVPGAYAAFVPEADHSASAARIRAASSANRLCSALRAARGQDALIATTSVDGDGNLHHRSGDQALMSFVVVDPHISAPTRGTVYVCSQPAFAMMIRGAYPDEIYYRAKPDHRVEWKSGPLTLRPDATLRVRLNSIVDASSW